MNKLYSVYFLFLVISLFLCLMLMWIPEKYKSKKTSHTAIRRIVFFLPYWIWIFFLKNKFSFFNISYLFIFILLTGILLFTDYKSVLFKSSSIYAELIGPLSFKNLLISNAVIISTLISEEIFFRGAFLTYFESIDAILIQAIFFVLAHYFTPTGKQLNKYDFLNQFVFSLISGFCFYYTKNIYLCFILHLVMNLPEIILNFKRYLIFKKELLNETI